MLKRALRRLLIPINPKLERTKIIQTIVATKKAATYLEIGVDQGKVFEIIHGPLKIGVDPISPSKKVRNILNRNNLYYQKTSDDFFQNDAPNIFSSRKIDVAFIDGLHEYQQVLKDINNTLNHLADDGIILVHDCNPISKAQAIRAFSFNEAINIAKKDKYSDWNGGWTGDVWKAIVHLRTNNLNLNICVLDCDCGIGIILKHPNTLLITPQLNVENLHYEDLNNNRNKFLNLKKARYFYKILKDIKDANRSKPTHRYPGDF